MACGRKNGGNRISWLNFDSYNLDISLYTQTSAERTRGPEELFLPELLRRDISDTNLRRKYLAEAHQRLTWPMYALGLALLAVTAMLSGEFNRRGHWKRIVVISTIAALMIIGALSLTNIVVRIPALMPILYLLITLLIVTCLYLLIHNKTRQVAMHPPVEQKA